MTSFIAAWTQPRRHRRRVQRRGARYGWAVTGNLLDGWRAEEYGRSRDGIPLRVFMPEADRPVGGLLIAAQHGEEAATALLARRLLERVSAHETD